MAMATAPGAWAAETRTSRSARRRRAAQAPHVGRPSTTHRTAVAGTFRGASRLLRSKRLRPSQRRWAFQCARAVWRRRRTKSGCTRSTGRSSRARRRQSQRFHGNRGRGFGLDVPHLGRRQRCRVSPDVPAAESDDQERHESHNADHGGPDDFRSPAVAHLDGLHEVVALLSGCGHVPTYARTVSPQRNAGSAASHLNRLC